MGTKKCVKWELLMTERDILRRIFRRSKDREGVKKIKINYELNNYTTNKIWLTTLGSKIELVWPCALSDKWKDDHKIIYVATNVYKTGRRKKLHGKLT